MKRFTALALALALTLSLLPFNALAILIPTDQFVPSGSFQLFRLIGPTTPTHTYIFEVDGTEKGRQIVKNGEKLIEPAAPEMADHKFIGWYVGGNQIDFTQPVEVFSTETITAIANFEKIYYVFFMDGTGADARVFVTKEGTTGDSVSTDVTLPIGSTQAVTGWYKDQGLSDGPVGNTYTIGAANQALWPKIEEGHYLYFASGENGSYIEPQFVLPITGVTVEPNPPTRPGYTFSHWSETEGGATPYTFGQSITEDLTLYAVWTANTDTQYTVVFWKQSVNDDKNAADVDKTYDFAGSQVRTAASGVTVSPSGTDTSMPYDNFHYNSTKSIGVEVKGDGTTILNVYYDRNLMTIDFYRQSGWSWTIDQTMTGLYGQTLS